MKKKILLISLFCCAMTQSLRAQMVEEKLTWKSTKSTDSRAPAPAASTLQKQKKAEMEKKWPDCANLGKTNSKKFPQLKAWVLISWLRCSREAGSERKNQTAVLAPLKVLDANPQLLLSGPWKNALASESVKARLSFLDSGLDSHTDAKTQEMWTQIESLMEQKEKLEKGQRAKLFQVAGDLSQAKAQLKAAQFFYEQSLLEQETKAVREKLNSLLFALNEGKPAEKAKGENGKEAEGNFEERFQASSKSNDLMALLEDCVAYLAKYPGGRKAKWAQDKALEIYINLSEPSKDEKVKALSEKALLTLSKADASRVTEWARALHRRSDYRGALKLSEKALETLASSNIGSTLTYIAGRSAQMTGQYDRALKHFENYIERSAGSEELVEVYFRLGLVHLRMKQASSAIAVFEKLLQMKGNDRYELSARYWLARSLQATDNTRALSVVDEILSKFPMSYYGLRLKMERTGGALEWPTAEQVPRPPKGDFYLTTTHKKSLERAQTLALNGWTAEALAEVIEIPFPTDPQVKVLLARQLADWQLYPPAIKLINEAGDLNSDLRSLDIIRLSLPQVHREAIQDQALKQKLSPYLVRSLIRQESAFGPRAVSSSNAYGLMQLIGPTAQEVASELGLRGLVIPDDVFLPENNIQMGTYYIAKMIRQFGGNVPLGLAAYNAGPQRLQLFVESRKEVLDQTQHSSSDPWDEMWFDELPWYETSFYVKAILRNTILYQLAEQAQNKNLDQRRVQFGGVLWANLVLKPES